MNRRIFVSKRKGFEAASIELTHILNQQLHIQGSVSLLNGYDIHNLNQETMEVAIRSVFSEAMIDEVHDLLPETTASIYVREPLPGQFDQRADAAMQCLKLLNGSTLSEVKTFEVAVFDRMLELEEEKRFLDYWINPIENRQKDLKQELEIEQEISNEGPLIGFREMNAEQIGLFRIQQRAAMTQADIRLIQNHFSNVEHRDPTRTEFKVLDTYWSDHCRHTTFETQLADIKIEEGPYKQDLEDALDLFKRYRETAGRGNRPITLMEMATIGGRVLNDPRIERSEEVNACSVRIEVETENKKEDWLLMFKNETHNHPTEIEPFGGASTCIGGAIRDPLSGRAYVYQAMRISGCGNVVEGIQDTLPGKLPQRVIAKRATQGNSSYGNQIGVATTYVKEIYHPRYTAKHLELGAVVGAVKASAVRRETPVAGDVIVLLGGRTGRDGIGGATGSSLAHTSKSLRACASEVQKGNAPEERKIQRLFRKESVSRMIKKCNDFGAGGVCVAIGELADGLEINLDVISTKYEGLNATELAISESQERMAVVLDPMDVQTFLDAAHQENIEATLVAIVTDQRRLIMKHQGKIVVDLDRTLIDTNGVRQQVSAQLIHRDSSFEKKPVFNEENALKHLSSLNVCSQKGLVEQFDASIGATTVLFPFGGNKQLTPTQGNVQRVYCESGTTSTVSILTHGFIPTLSEQNMFLSAQGAVLESIAKTIALGGKVEDVFFSFQEYFPKLANDSKKWGDVIQALLGALSVQDAFKRPAIGGKDSMSGSFKEMDVLETLVSFACSATSENSIVSQEAKEVGNGFYFIEAKRKANGLFDLEAVRKTYLDLQKAISEKSVRSARVIENSIFASVCEMVFGNGLGVEIDTDLDLFANYPAGLIIEAKEEINKEWVKIGVITEQGLRFNDVTIDSKKAVDSYLYGLDFLYPVTQEGNAKSMRIDDVDREVRPYQGPRVDKVHVVIPFFPGTNCENDTSHAFEKAGAIVNVHGIRNLTPLDLEESIDTFCMLIKQSQILALPGGFSAGDQPDGSAKFIVNVLRNQKVRSAIEDLLRRDGLILGICNGFQALIKTGLLPYGEYRDLDEHDATLTHNAIGRHISAIVNTRIASNASPWLKNIRPGSCFKVPLSHGEGRIVVREDQLKMWAKNGQIATQYCDVSGIVTNDPNVNLNASDGAIEGLLSPDGRIFGKMGHTERVLPGLYRNIPSMSEFRIFENAVAYFTTQEEE